MPKYTIDATTVWINTHLEPHEALWLNYHCLFVTRIHFRTTSFDEALYWSMKVVMVVLDH